MKYRQVETAGENTLATRVALKIEGRWVDSVLLDKKGNVLPLPCEVKAGEQYIIEVDNATK